MNNAKLKGIIIDFIILVVLAFLLMIGIYVIYDIFPKLPRFIVALIILCMIPIFWGTIIFSIMGKKTIGNKIANRNNNITK